MLLHYFSKKWISFFNCSKRDYVKVNRLAMLENWDVLISNNGNKVRERFKAAYLSIRNECVPLTKKNRNKCK